LAPVSNELALIHQRRLKATKWPAFIKTLFGICRQPANSLGPTKPEEVIRLKGRSVESRIPAP
jgi:hypothetical protein